MRADEITKDASLSPESMTDIIEIYPPVKVPSIPWITIGLACLLVMALVFLLFRYLTHRRRLKPIPIKSPQEKFSEILTSLENDVLDDRQFYADARRAVSLYVEVHLGRDVEALTGDELKQVITSTSLFDAYRSPLITLIDRYTNVLFACESVSKEERAEDLQMLTLLFP